MSLPPRSRTVFVSLALAVVSTISLARAEQWPSEEVRQYWTQGKGEITRYKLTQSRYGELHDGDAVLIYASEPFSRSKQVKLDDWQHAGDDAVEVLKLNFSKKFVTGIYPYSFMSSVFTPVDLEKSPRSLKAEMTGQEWCGNVFTQLNFKGDHYDAVGFSYFESEGDTQKKLPGEFIEDEIWTRLRLAPEKLPTGEFQIIPGLFISRLCHVSLKAEKARGTYFDPEAAKFDPAKIQGYRLEYLTSYDRVLNIYFERAMPHGIVAWDDTYTEFGKNHLTTHAERTKTILLDYWAHHKNVDRALRQQLDLPENY